MLFTCFNVGGSRCLCGTPSCRGFLEVFEDEEHMKELTGRRSGLWVSSAEALKLADSATSLPDDATAHSSTQKSQEGAEWLIKKRVKVWWEGNDAYFEADVVSFDPVSGLHKVYYLMDNDMSEERLWARGNNNGSSSSTCGGDDVSSRGTAQGKCATWQLLDETRDEKVIGLKKRPLPHTDTDTDSGGAPPSLDFLSPLKKIYPLTQTSSPAVQHQKHLVSPASKVVDKSVTVSLALCSFIATQYKIGHPQFSLKQPANVSSKKTFLFSLFVEIVKKTFGANSRWSASNTTSPGVARMPVSPRSGTDSGDDSFGVTVFGEAAAVDAAVEFVEASKKLLV